MDESKKLIAKYFGQPIDPNLHVSMELSEIAQVPEPLPAGEPAYTLIPDDSNGVDTIYTFDSNGAITEVKITLSTATELTFAHYNSKLEYILLNDIEDGVDQEAFARRKAAMTRTMDKWDLKRAIDIILAASARQVTQATGDDVYSMIKKLKRAVSPYGSDFVLLTGDTVDNSISDYDKDNAGSLYYSPDIFGMMAKEGIKKVKITGYVKLDSGSNLPLLAVDRMIIVARTSSLLDGKPVLFCRRKIKDEAAKFMEVENAYRGVVNVGLCQVLYGGAPAWGYGLVGYESNVTALLNKYAVAWCIIS